MVDHRRHAGIAQQDFVHVVRGRIALIGRHHVQVERGAHGGQFGAEAAHDLRGALLRFRMQGRIVAADVMQFQTHLVQQRIQGRADGVPDIEVLDLFAQVDGTQAHREQGPTEILDDLAQAFLRGELAQAGVVAQPASGTAPGDARVAQAGHDAVQVPVGGGNMGGAVHCRAPDGAPADSA
ncbi:hypothetical protein D3C86_320440 [compost metagenome]